MKHYNIQNYIRYKNDLEVTLKRVEKKDFHEYTRDELIITFLPLVENLARKFATSQQASGVMAITDLIQEGALNLIKAVDRIDWETIKASCAPGINSKFRKFTFRSGLCVQPPSFAALSKLEITPSISTYIIFLFILFI